VANSRNVGEAVMLLTRSCRIPCKILDSMIRKACDNVGSWCTSSNSRLNDSLYSSVRSLKRFISKACSALASVFRFMSCNNGRHTRLSAAVIYLLKYEGGVIHSYLSICVVISARPG
jgi:hypothetical protein